MIRSTRWVAPSLALLASVLLLAHDAWPARAPDIVQKSFTYRGEAARAFASLLGLTDDRRTVQFELSQLDEHSALPERDKALRDPSGTLGQLEWRTSTMIHETATWDPGAIVLRLDGYVADRNTALPHQGGLAFSFASPQFTEIESDRIPGWQPLLPKLSALPGTAAAAGAVVRTLNIPLEGHEHAELSLWHLQTWNAMNQPVPKSMLTVAFGPELPGPAGKADKDEAVAPSGSSASPGSNGSRACGCRVGPVGDARGPAAAGAVFWLSRRRRRAAISRNPPRASRAPR